MAANGGEKQGMGGKGGWLAWWQAGRLVGWLVGCGGADLHVNRGREHVDLQCFRGLKTCRGLAGWLAGGLVAGTPIYV